jgi:hypothetical protein
MKGLRLAILLLGLVVTVISATAPVLANSDGNPIPTCPPGTKICR